MVVPIRRKKRAVTPYRLTLWLTVLLLGALYYVQNAPLRLDAQPASHDGVEITREASGDIVIVLDYKAIRESGPSFETKDWSAAWLNVIEQEIGPVTIATPTTLSQRTLEGARVIILTSSVVDQIDTSLLRTLRQWVLDGNLLVSDQPRGLLREAFSADGRAGARRGQQITFAKDLPEPFASELQSMPLSTSYVGSTSAREDATTLLSVDGAPAIYAVPIGQGYVITFDFDLGEQLVALQQGKPSSNFTVRPRNRPADATPRTEDLVLDDRLRGSTVPYADLLERFVVWGVIARYAATPGYWYFPDGAKGAVILLHEDSRLGDGGGWMLEHENQERAFSTLLTSVGAGLTSEGAEAIHRRGGEVGLLWQMANTPLEVQEPAGIKGFNPFLRPVALKPQLDQIRTVLPVSYIRTSRTAEGWWSDQWSAPFRELADHGIRMDTSYAVAGHSGFAFGTGIPFQVFDDTGMPLGLREIPIIIPSHTTEGPSLEALLEVSRAGHHQVITVSTDPASFADYPDVDRFEAWLSLFDQARQAEHAMTSSLRFDTFQRSRRAGNVKSRLLEEVPLPRELRGSTPGRSTATVLRITAEAKTRGMWLVFPEHVRDRTFLTARQGAKRVRTEIIAGEAKTEVASIVGIGLRSIALDQGFNTIEVYYH